MAMKIVEEMPTEGQFVAVWENCGGVWTDMHQIIDGKMFVFDNDEWKPCQPEIFYVNKQAIFIVKEA